MDDLGNRLKSYEAQETARKFIPGVPIYARVDGRGFSKFTQDMERPFDARMQAAMIYALQYVVDKSHASIGYHQSDELSVAWTNQDHTAEPWFGGKIHKLTSVLASMVTIAFVEGIMNNFPNWQELLLRMPHFDCRVFQVPNLDELANCMLWRNLDCVKNSISQAASHYYSHSELMHKSSFDKLSMLADKGIDYDTEYSAAFRLGTFVVKRKVLKDWDPAIWAQIPIMHRPPLDQVILRAEVEAFNLPPLNSITNLPNVLFKQEVPILKETFVS